MTAILLIGSVAFLVMQTISLRFIKISNLRENIFVNAAFSGLIGIGLLIYSFIQPVTYSIATIISGCIFGALFIATVSFYYYAMQSGPLSYTTFFFSASMLIPALAGIFFFKEAPKATTILGVLLFLIAFYFISVLGAAKGKKGNFKWFILSIVTFFLNGSLAVVSKTQQTILNGKEVMSMMTICFCSAAVFAFIMYFIMLATAKQKSALKSDIKTAKSSWLCIIGAALGTGGGNIILTYLCSRIPSAYLFPLVQGAIMIAITLYSLTFLKEKMNKYGVIGICTGLAAIIIINL